VEAKILRAQADRCRRLAKAIYNAAVASDLEAYARQLDHRAAALEEAIGGFAEMAQSPQQSG
jgi:hypothetical protein